MVFMESMEILVVMESMVFADNYGFYGNYQNYENCGKSGKCGNHKARGGASGSPLICPNRVHIWGGLFIWDIWINYLEYLGKK